MVEMAPTVDLGRHDFVPGGSARLRSAENVGSACQARTAWRRRGRSMELHVLIRNVLSDHGRLSVDAETLDESADLHEAGLSSHATVAVMVAIEDALDIEFPDRMLNRRTFESIEALRSSVESLIVAA